MIRVNFILATCMLLTAACSSDDEITVQQKPFIFEAVAEDLAYTRTNLSDDGVTILWEANDSLSVFLGGDIMCHAVIYGEAKSSVAKFMVDGKFIIGGTEDDEGDIYTNVALYPYYKFASLPATDTVQTLFPTYQKAVLSSIPNGSPMVAVVGNVSTTSFTFKSVSSFIRFSMTSPVDVPLSHIVLTSDNKAVAGEVLVNVASADAKLLGTGANTITLDCSGISIGTTPTRFFMALLPTAFADDEWGVELFDANGGSMKFVLPAFTFARNKFYTLNVNYVPV